MKSRANNWPSVPGVWGFLLVMWLESHKKVHSLHSSTCNLLNCVGSVLLCESRLFRRLSCTRYHVVLVPPAWGKVYILKPGNGAKKNYRWCIWKGPPSSSSLSLHNMKISRLIPWVFSLSFLLRHHQVTVSETLPEAEYYLTLLAWKTFPCHPSDTVPSPKQAWSQMSCWGGRKMCSGVSHSKRSKAVSTAGSSKLDFSWMFPSWSQWCCFLYFSSQ